MPLPLGYVGEKSTCGWIRTNTEPVLSRASLPLDYTGYMSYPHWRPLRTVGLPGIEPESASYELAAFTIKLQTNFLRRLEKIPIAGIEPALDWFLASCLYRLGYMGLKLIQRITP